MFSICCCCFRYCAKLPSDIFTRLTPTSTVIKTENGGYQASIKLPINCRLKQTITVGIRPGGSSIKTYRQCKLLIFHYAYGQTAITAAVCSVIASRSWHTAVVRGPGSA